MQIKLANPRGFCAGVDRAIEIVNRALEVFGPPIYVRHEVVHNKFVVEDLRARGAIGNVIDRFLHGHVVDFIQWYMGDHYWPAFNIADCAVVGGAIGIAAFGLFSGKQQGKGG